MCFHGNKFRQNMQVAKSFFIKQCQPGKSVANKRNINI